MLFLIKELIELLASEEKIPSFSLTCAGINFDVLTDLVA